MMVVVVAPVLANTADGCPLAPFLVKLGDMGGFRPGRAQVFRTVAAVRSVSGEKPAESEIRRDEAEGFVEAAMARIHAVSEPAAKGISSVIEFETPTGATAEMKAELKEELDPKVLPTAEKAYFSLRHFKVPGVPNVIAFAFVSNKAASKFEAETGIAKGLFTEGNCLIAVSIYRPMSKEVTGPVVSGVQAIFGRTGGACP
jgi:hypothetical protein